MEVVENLALFSECFLLLPASKAVKFQLDGTVCGRLRYHRIKLTEGRKCAL